MSTDNDHYQTLGVLPGAEQIVITAAYRALASQYHPDKWQGDKDVATRKMAAINVAYGVLGDSEKRKAYDAQRSHAHGKFDEPDAAEEQAFDDAISGYEDSWQTACEVFPDLMFIRKQLAKTSHRLAFAFVVQVIETKKFNSRHDLANAMEKAFLERYFGTNPDILGYAKQLIQWGYKDAIKKLNTFVEVLGSDVDASAIIKKIESELNLSERRARFQREEAAKAREEAAKAKIAKTIESLRNSVIYQPLSNDTFAYARLLGYEVIESLGGFFKPNKYVIRKGEGPTLFETDKYGAMCLWIKNNLT